MITNNTRTLSAAMMAMAFLAPTIPVAAQSSFASPEAREEAAARLEAIQRYELEKAQALARKGGIKSRAEVSKDEALVLVGVDERGKPIYYQTTSANTALSAGSSLVHSEPVNAKGFGVLVGIWDAGNALAEHQEFAHPNGTRIIHGDSGWVDNHATATSGVIAAQGVRAGVMGGAPDAMVVTHDYVIDAAEATREADATPDDDAFIGVSNHSYGQTHGWQPGQVNLGAGTGFYWMGHGYKPDGTGNRTDPNFGGYGRYSKTWDELAYNAPYYLHVRSAGNDRRDRFQGNRTGSGKFFYWTDEAGWAGPVTWNAATAPLDERDLNYDTLIEESMGKNVLSVGAVDDAVTDGQRDFTKATPANFSGWGPADDGRVKPDLVANGVGVTMPVATTTSSYSAPTANGTSFSSPSVAAVGAQILSLARQHLGSNLRASTLKAILLHSAYDLGLEGPDAIYGWGHVDAVAASEIVLKHSTAPRGNFLLESALNNTINTGTYTLHWDGASELRVSLCWTDPAGEILNEVANNRTPALVNDLDLRLVSPSGVVHLPYMLDPTAPASAATRGDNLVDTLEQIRVPVIAAETGLWTVTVTHKGTLVGTEQVYSLVATGQSDSLPLPPLQLASLTPSEGRCNNTVALEVAGAGFAFGSQLRLRSLSRTVTPGVEGFGVAAQTIRICGKLDLVGIDPGVYDVVVIRPDGQESTMPGAFRVTAEDGSSSEAGWRDLDEW